MEDDRTLQSPAHGLWTVQALESGMPPADVAAVARVRLQLIAAATICSEVLGTSPPMAVTAVFQEICGQADRQQRDLTWPRYEDQT